ncbi:helix-turn-helix domain-containing protein [Streptomyces sp. NPDC004111]|uniref:GbsR/MarR family transcriptional regulator n=1 Tax=Streptomyces sp. NPDC004111 TaxID=3364690 RepID=UPI0036C3434C
MPGGRLTPQERRRIAAGLSDGLPYAEIARRLGRPTSTVSREIARNGGPGDYRPEQAHRATVRRARRGAPERPRTHTAGQPGPGGTAGAGGTTGAGEARDTGGAARTVEEEIIDLVVMTGLPRTTARVHVALLLAEDGRHTAAELADGLRVSPASVSVAVNYLLQHGYIRRERDHRRRRDIYVLDDEAWYHSLVVGSRQTLALTGLALTAAQRLGPDSPVGQRLTRGGTFLDHVISDTMDSARRWRHLLS